MWQLGVVLFEILSNRQTFNTIDFIDGHLRINRVLSKGKKISHNLSVNGTGAHSHHFSFSFFRVQRLLPILFGLFPYGAPPAAGPAPTSVVPAKQPLRFAPIHLHFSFFFLLLSLTPTSPHWPFSVWVGSRFFCFSSVYWFIELEAKLNFDETYNHNSLFYYAINFENRKILCLVLLLLLIEYFKKAGI